MGPHGKCGLELTHLALPASAHCCLQQSPALALVGTHGARGAAARQHRDTG